MPVYVYRCKKGHEFERIASVTTPGEPLDNTECPVVPIGRKKACGAPAELHQGLTAKPKFKRGIGGFHAPNC